MKKPPNPIRYPVLLTFLATYAVVLFVPLLIGALTFTRTFRVVEEEGNRANAAMLEQVRQGIDGRLADLQVLARKIGFDARVEALMLVKDAPEAAQRYTMAQILNDFSSYAASNAFLGDFYVYFRNTGLILTSRCSFLAERDYPFFNRVDGLSYADWRSFVNAPHAGDYTAFRRALPGGPPGRLIAFAQSLPIQYQKDAQATVVVLLDESVLREAVHNVAEASRGAVYLVNSRDEILFTTGTQGQAPPVAYGDIGDGSGLADGRIGGREVAVSYVKSALADWKYVSVVDKSVFRARLIHTRRWAFAGLAFCLLVGGGMVILFAKMNYDPLRALLRFLSKRGAAVRDGRNEYAILGDMVARTFDETESLRRRLDQQNAFLRDHFVARLIRGRVGDAVPIEEACASYGIRFASRRFAVLVFYILDCDMEVDLVRFVVRNVAEEMLQERYTAHMSESEDILLALVNVPDAPGGPDAAAVSTVLDDLAGRMRKAREFLQTRFRALVSVSISDVHEGLGSLPAAYREGVEAVEYCNLTSGSGGIVRYADFRPRTEMVHTSHENAEEERRLVELLRAGDFRGAQAAVDGILDGWFRQDTMPIQMAKCRMFALVNTIIGALGSARFAVDGGFWADQDPVGKLLGCATVAQLRREIGIILEAAAERVETRKDGRATRLREEVISFIEDRYGDPNLNVTMIADHMGMGIASLSRFFKRETGIGVLDFIHDVRVTRAQRLLLEGDRSLKEVAEETGFCNMDTLIRAFKKSTGVTPGRYREANLDAHRAPGG